MKSLNFKRFKIISFVILISICATGIKNNFKENVVSTMSVPVTNKVIIVDAGHGRRRWRSCK